MSFRIVWSEHAVDVAAGFLADDGPGLQRLLDLVDQLARDPRPPDSVPYGSLDLRRLRVGRYRVLYEVDRAGEAVDDDETITIIHVGRPEPSCDQSARDMVPKGRRSHRCGMREHLRRTARTTS